MEFMRVVPVDLEHHTGTNFKNNTQRSWMDEEHILKPYNIMDIAGTSQGNGSRLFEWRNHG
jgi:hypothetical protein